MDGEAHEITQGYPHVKSWHPQQETILKAWGEAAACYRYIHHQSFMAYAKTTQRATLPVIVLSTITGTASFAMESVPEELRPIASQSIGAGNLIAGLIATISTFLKLQENTQMHKVAALNFGKFSRKIRLELALPLKDRTKDGAVMIDECKAEYDRLLEEAPDIPKKQLEDFERTFPGNELYKPEIIQIHPIRTFAGIRENLILRTLRNFMGDSAEKKKLVKELEAIRKAGEGLVTAPKKTFALKRGLFRRQAERHVELVTPVQSDDEEEELDDVIDEDEEQQVDDESG